MKKTQNRTTLDRLDQSELEALTERLDAGLRAVGIQPPAASGDPFADAEALLDLAQDAELSIPTVRGGFTNPQSAAAQPAAPPAPTKTATQRCVEAKGFRTLAELEACGAKEGADAKLPRNPTASQAVENATGRAETVDCVNQPRTSATAQVLEGRKAGSVPQLSDRWREWHGRVETLPEGMTATQVALRMKAAAAQ